MSDSERVPVGRIVGAFGIRGQVKVEPLTDFLERFDKGAVLYLDGEPLRITGSQIHKGRILLSFKEVPDANAAEKLQWKTLEADPIEDLELEEDEFLTEDLIGLLVLTEDGRPLGKVDNVLPYPAQDILVVDRLMIPAVKEFVRSVDLEKGQIVVRLLEGMEE
ncbi:MAG TPA: ribosome maturation factor RimM [Fimbriimonadaceae bacterium]|nr:ribosome maturation factor RimM [Fimbriimonadaceae bacterium]